MMAMWNEITEVLRGCGLVKVHSPVTQAVAAERYQAAPSDGWYFGTLQTKRGALNVYLSVPDLDFVRPPAIWLPERPTWLRGWRPHLLACTPPLYEWVCYSDHEKYQLLPHEPARALLRVLEDTVTTFDRIADPHTVIEDSRREIALLWDSRSHRIYIDVEPEAQPVICPVGLVDHAGAVCYLVSKNPSLLAKKLQIADPVPIRHQAIVFPESDASLYLTAAGPPSDLAQIRLWLKETSPVTYRQWHAAMTGKAQFDKAIGLHFFRTANQVIGFHMPSTLPWRTVKGRRLQQKFVNRLLHTQPAEISRLSALRLDDTFLIRRNLAPETQDLRGMKVLLVGCGAVGGYLAASLLQLGAGIDSTSIGQLTLCDPQVLSSENIGRHMLGLAYLGQKKVTALSAELQLRRPGVRIEPVDASFHALVSRLDDFDIIINAAGSEAVGRYMSRTLRQLQWHRRSRVLLHSWIEGRGGVARSLVEDSARAACFDCMWQYSVNKEPRMRHEAYSEPHWNEPVADGYATMTPFAVSASLSATALAVDALLAWRINSPTPRFRSRSVESHGVKPAMSLDLKPMTNCPSCSI